MDEQTEAALMRAGAQIEQLQTELAKANAERRAEYWKAEHNAANKRIAEYQAMLQEAADMIVDYCDHMGAPYPDALLERIEAAMKEHA